ncbi:MAG: DNA mismatch repair endonuclease MutL [Roseburia sp.]|nr:DNA mismatch repair endonuclease MutL [Anaeroplasma bactoclasticum]MCM1196479.1 DNA mismatch repair endonuclease MutL [Roseburia sp.]
MGKITKMSPHLANMIAAGEVVEKPSSVVKELVENAIDANAKNIRIFLQEGGLKEIKVVDDGEGMDEEDVRLAFLPHATSKIKTEYDLSRILSLGFRGEAIASIAAVSKMQIKSSRDGKGGYQVTYQAGSMLSSGPIPSNKGTTVTVENLFFNTPARLKYLKPVKNELASITYLMDRIALAHPEIRFMLINDNKTYLSTTASNQISSLMGEIYGLDVAKSLLEESFITDGVEARLVLVKPEIYRANKLEITLLVNGRYVKNYNITNAIVEGFRTYLPIGKYPVAVFYLEIDPTLVDVNVHPSKTEVKISNEEQIILKLTEAIHKALESTILIPTRQIYTMDNNVGYERVNIFELPRTIIQEESQATIETPLQPSIPIEKEETQFILKEDSTSYKTSTQAQKLEEQKKLPHFEYVGQVFGTYLIFQNEEGMYLMDQHAAAERINYEKNYELLGNANQPTQELLVPILLKFTKSEALFIEEHLLEFEKIGFLLEPMSNQDYVLRQVPLWAKLDNACEIIRKIFALLIENKKVDVITFRDSIAKQISCKGSIKANHALSRIEIDSLLEQLNQCKNPYTCPHGRPTIIKFSSNDLEKMFERIQS